MSTHLAELSQISHSAISRIATPRIDFALALAVRQLANRQADKPKYLLEPEITVLLAQGFSDLRKRMFFDVLWNTGARLSEALAVTPENIHTGERWPSRPFVSLMTLKQQGKPGRPPKDSYRDVPLFDEGFTLRLRDHLDTFWSRPASGTISCSLMLIFMRWRCSWNRRKPGSRWWEEHASAGQPGSCVWS
nr:hypothetical protein [Klebsiella oxytoca]